MKILFATDGSRSAENALEHLPELIESSRSAERLEVVLLAVSGAHPGGPVSMRLDSTTAIASLVRSKEILARQGINPKSIWRVGSDAASAIVDVASSEHADMVVLGCRPRSASEAALGRVSDRVLRESPVPVLLVKPPAA